MYHAIDKWLSYSLISNDNSGHIIMFSCNLIDKTKTIVLLQLNFTFAV